MDPTLLARLSIPEELLRLCPPLTAAQGAARRKADDELQAKYPIGCYLAYLDTWRGDELDRVVLVATTDWEEYQRQLAALAPDVNNRIGSTRVRDPEEGLRGLYPRLVGGE